MKTTVNTGENRRFVVEPGREGVSVRMEIRERSDRWDLASLFTLTPDQAGALMFGIEQAIEATELAAQRKAMACRYARICEQEGECVNGCAQRLGVPA